MCADLCASQILFIFYFFLNSIKEKNNWEECAEYEKKMSLSWGFI